MELRLTRRDWPMLRSDSGDRVHVVEALYLLYTGKARIVDEQGRELGFEELMGMYSLENPYAWVEFEVYLDLRRRGRIALVGPRPHSFLVRRSKKDPRFRYYVLVMEESRLLPVSSIKDFVEEALRNGWEPLLAIVDRYGDITYYAATLLRPRKLEARWLREVSELGADNA